MRRATVSLGRQPPSNPWNVEMSTDLPVMKYYTTGETVLAGKEASRQDYKMICT